MSEEQNKDGAKSKPDTPVKPGESPSAGASTGKSDSAVGKKPDAAKTDMPPSGAPAPSADKRGSEAPSSSSAGQQSSSKTPPGTSQTSARQSSGSNRPAGKKKSAQDKTAETAPADKKLSTNQPAKTQAAPESGAKDKIAQDQRAIEQRVKDQAAKDQTAKERVAKFQASREQDTKSQPGKSGSAQPAASSKSTAAGESNPPQRSTGGAGTGGSSRYGSGTTGSGGKQASTALIVAVVALLLAVLAAAGAGWLWYRGQSQLAALNSRVDTVEQSLQSNVQKVVMPRLSKMDDRLQSLSSDVSGLSDQDKQRKQQTGQFQQKLQALQSQNAKLADRLDGTHARFVQQRVESLLEAANQRLTIYQDPKASMQALQLADTAIKQAGDPRLFPVRKDIANEIAAIKALPDADTQGLSLKLSNLIGQVPQLPLSTNVPSEYSNNSSDQTQNNSGGSDDKTKADNKSQSVSERLTSIDVAGGWHHFVDSISNALSHMVTIRRANGTQNAPALMAPDQSYFLTQNLQLQLRSAQLALLDKDTQTYRDNLSSAKAWIKQYYAADDSAVKAALATLNELSNVKLDWQAPDITASLETLRNIMSQSSGDSSANQASNDKDNENGNGNGNGNGGSEQ